MIYTVVWQGNNLSIQVSLLHYYMKSDNIVLKQIKLSCSKVYFS